MTEQPVTQAQDHDLRLGRLEGIAEQLVEQGRQTNARFDRIEQAIADQGRELRQAQATQFRWLVGIQITTLIALGSLLFSILSKLPG